MILDVNKDIKIAFLDILRGDRLFVAMSTLVNADALRVARTLAGLNQRQVEAESKVAQKSIVAAESARKPSSLQTNKRLCAYYESKGIEFLGTPLLREPTVVASGARWQMPPILPIDIDTDTAFHTELNGVSFAAARSLLGLRQKEVSNRAAVTQRNLAALELGEGYNFEAHRRLRAYYEEEGVEFLGWGDVSTTKFYGVGVRWKPEAKFLLKFRASSADVD